MPHHRRRCSRTNRKELIHGVELGPSRDFGEETSNECNQPSPLSRCCRQDDFGNAPAGAISGQGDADDSGRGGPHMPEDYVGLSYEVQQLVDLPFPKPLRAWAERNNRDIPARQLSNMAMVAAATRGRLRAWCGIETWVRRIDRIGHRLCLPPPWKKP
jgi:hypothetical protein